ncbi:helix-turn-helix domain-containing protein [Nocardia sp. NPDC052001]|uniref:helix-turn-helix domain-containing protein n=1 Tax=Nocardia sp. NPDC052001 TaxID=3154853 RepID=UPI00344AF9FA
MSQPSDSSGANAGWELSSIDPALWPERIRRQVMGGYLQRRRTELGFTQAYVASRLQTKEDTYSRWERGTRFPDTATLEQIFDVLELPFWAMRKIQSLVFTRAHRLRLGEWPPKLTEDDFDHLEAIDAPAYLHLMPQYDMVARNFRAAEILPDFVPAPFTADRPVNVIAWQLRAMTDGDRRIVNIEDVLSRLVWLLKTMGLGIVEPTRMAQIRSECIAINRDLFEDLWRTGVPEEKIYDPEVIMLDPDTGKPRHFTMRCKHDIHPPKEYETYVMAEIGLARGVGVDRDLRGLGWNIHPAESADNVVSLNAHSQETLRGW